MVFEPESLRAFTEGYPAAPVSLRHRLSGHPLLAIDRLVALARALPVASVEYNSGDLPVGQDPARTPMNGLSPEETVRRIAENRSWIVLKRVEQDGDYAALLDECLAEIAPAAAATTGAMHKREAFIFVSSPESVTPFHMDPEHNILLQISGAKTFNIFPATAAEIVSDKGHEAFHIDGAHRNLPYKDEFAPLARPVALTPGGALYVPVKSPHWVKVGSEVSVSLSITWRSRASDDEAHLRRANGWLRARGLTPPTPGASPVRDRTAILAARLAARLPRR